MSKKAKYSKQIERSRIAKDSAGQTDHFRYEFAFYRVYVMTGKYCADHEGIASVVFHFVQDFVARY